jgi:hypothetical protein
MQLATAGASTWIAKSCRPKNIDIIQKLLYKYGCSADIGLHTVILA